MESSEEEQAKVSGLSHKPRELSLNHLKGALQCQDSSGGPLLAFVGLLNSSRRWSEISSRFVGCKESSRGPLEVSKYCSMADTETGVI